jgi:hypothetical protein
VFWNRNQNFLPVLNPPPPPPPHPEMHSFRFRICIWIRNRHKMHYKCPRNDDYFLGNKIFYLKNCDKYCIWSGSIIETFPSRKRNQNRSFGSTARQMLNTVNIRTFRRVQECALGGYHGSDIRSRMRIREAQKHPDPEHCRAGSGFVLK